MHTNNLQEPKTKKTPKIDVKNELARLKIKRKENKTQKECNKECARTITKKKTQWPPKRLKKTQTNKRKR